MLTVLLSGICERLVNNRTKFEKSENTAMNLRPQLLFMIVEKVLFFVIKMTKNYTVANRGASLLLYSPPPFQ